MKIQVIDCNYLFIGSMVKEIKNNIISYHQGFMVVNDTLYLPLYQVLQRKYSLPKQYETTIIDLDDVDRFDCLATYFYKVNALDIDDVIDLYNDWLDNELKLYSIQLMRLRKQNGNMDIQMVTIHYAMRINLYGVDTK